MNFDFFDPLRDKKQTLINLQWLVVVATSYLLLFKNERVVQDPWAIYLVLALLTSSLALHCLPESAFDHSLFAPALVVVDTILVSVAIGLNRERPWDLFIVFFFGLFIAATGESLFKIIAGCLIISVISVLISPFLDMNLSRLDSDLLFRIPFLFGVFILYGYLADQARKEKNRAEKAEAT